MSTLKQRVRHLVVVSVAVILSSITSGCLMDVAEDDDSLAEAEMALIGGDPDVDPVDEDGFVQLPGHDLGDGQRGFNPEPQPWKKDAVGGDQGGPEPQPWREDGDADGPEPQPWHSNLVGDDEGDGPELPGDGVDDDDEPDPSPWMAELEYGPREQDR